MDIRLVLYSGNTFQRILTEAVDVKFAIPLNDTPSLTFNIPITQSADAYTPEFSFGHLLGYDVVVEVSDETGTWSEYPSSRFTIISDDCDPSDPSSTNSIVAVGIDNDLSGMVCLDPTKFVKGERAFESATAGVFMRTFLEEGQTENLGILLDWDFTDTHDSDGNPWDLEVSMTLSPTVTARQILDSITSQGMCDWRFEGNTLRMFNTQLTPFGSMYRDRTYVKLMLGREIFSSPIRQSIAERVNKVLVVGDEGLMFKRSTGPALLSPRGARAAVLSQGGVSQVDTATALADAELAERILTREEAGHSISIHSDCEYLPFLDYFVGDEVYHNTRPTSQGSLENDRVYQITIEVNEGTVTGVVLLKDRWLEHELQNAKRIKGIVGGSTISGGNNTTPTTSDSQEPAQVTGLLLSTTSETDAEGAPTLSSILASWTAVALDVNGTPLTPTSYEVQYRKTADSDWESTITSVGVTQIIKRLAPTVGYTIRVRATHNGYVGAWSDLASITTGIDSSAPQTPSTPTLSTAAGMVHVHWDGKDDTGSSTSWPNDMRGVDVYIDGINSGSMYGDQHDIVLESTAGASISVTLKAVDNSGNASTASGSAITTVKSVLDDPVLNETGISGTLITDNSITTPKLLAGSITSDKVKAGAITTDKLALGTVTTNPVFDGGFEETYDVENGKGDLGWNGTKGFGCTVSREVGLQRSGTRNLKVSLPSNAVGVTHDSGRFPVTAGSVYRVSSHFTATVARNVELSLVTSSDGFVTSTKTVAVLVRSVAGPVSPTTIDYAPLNGDVTVPAGHTEAKVRLSVPVDGAGAVGAAIVRFDDVACIQSGMGGATEITSAGMRLFSNEGDEVAAFVSNRPNSFSVQSGSNTVAAIRTDGGAQFSSLNVLGDPVFQGASLSSTINALPMGTKFFAVGANFTDTTTTTELGFGEIAFTPKVGRQYKLTWHPPMLYAGTVPLVAEVNVRYTTNGTIPTVISPMLQQQQVHFSTAAVFNTPPNITVFFNVSSTPTNPWRFIGTVLRVSGSGVLMARSAAGDYSPQWWQIEDVGPTSSYANQSIAANTGGGTGTPPVQTYEKTYGVASWNTYSGGGSARTGVSNAYQGYYSGTWGNQYSRMIFDSAIVADLSGATVNGAWLYFECQHTYAGSGAPAVIVRGDGTSVGSPTVVAGGSYEVGIPVGALPSSGQYAYGFGQAPSNSQTYYAYFNPTSMRLRVNYTK